MYERKDLNCEDNYKKVNAGQLLSVYKYADEIRDISLGGLLSGVFSHASKKSIEHSTYMIQETILKALEYGDKYRFGCDKVIPRIQNNQLTDKSINYLSHKANWITKGQSQLIDIRVNKSIPVLSDVS